MRELFETSPGWFPGTPRLGDPTFVAKAPARAKYDPPLASPLLHVYTVAHFSVSLLIPNLVIGTAWHKAGPGAAAWSLVLMLYVLWTITSVGLLYDDHRAAWLSELLRCSVSCWSWYLNGQQQSGLAATLTGVPPASVRTVPIAIDNTVVP